jgi:hypothetical protein
VAIFTSGVTQTSVTAAVMNKLTNLYRDLRSAQELFLWLSEYALSDLEGLGFSANDGQEILNAVADANELATLYFGGALGSYELPYNFSASQLAVIGPGG